MPPDLALSSTLDGSNYPCLELIFLDPKVFEPLKFDCCVQVNETDDSVFSITEMFLCQTLFEIM